MIYANYNFYDKTVKSVTQYWKLNDRNCTAFLTINTQLTQIDANSCKFLYVTQFAPPHPAFYNIFGKALPPCII